MWRLPRLRGKYTLGNLFIFVCALFITYLCFGHESAEPFLFGYSWRYGLALLILSVAVLAYGFVIFRRDEATNQYLFFCVVLVFLTLEVGLRVMNGVAPYTADVFRQPVPYLMFTGQPGAQANMPRALDPDAPAEAFAFTFGETGFLTDQAAEKAPTPGVTRIAVLGGSTVFNGAPLENSIPGQIEALLPESEVLNFGGVSYVSGQELSALVHTVADYQPDMVVVYDGVNDLNTPYSYDPRPGYPYNFATTEAGIERMSGRFRLTHGLANVLQQSLFIRQFFGGALQRELLDLRSLQADANYQTPEWEEAIVDSYISNLEKICLVGQGLGAQVHVFFQPVVHTKSPLTAAEEPLLGTPDFHAYLDRQYDRVRPRLRELQTRYADTDCAFRDLSTVFANDDRELYWDFVHTTNEGNATIAEHIVRFIAASQSDPSSRSAARTE